MVRDYSEAINKLINEAKVACKADLEIDAREYLVQLQTVYKNLQEELAKEQSVYSMIHHVQTAVGNLLSQEAAITADQLAVLGEVTPLLTRNFDERAILNSLQKMVKSGLRISR